MNDCCVENLKKMHAKADYFWWFQRFVAASPFVLIIPDFDPTSGLEDLLQTGTQKSIEIGYGLASNAVYKNQSLPDFADAVKAIGKISYNELRRDAQAHAVRHTPKELDIANFWTKMAIAYDKAFSGA